MPGHQGEPDLHSVLCLAKVAISWRWCTRRRWRELKDTTIMIQYCPRLEMLEAGTDRTIDAGGGKAGGFRGSRPAALYKHFLEPGSESYFERRVKVGLAVVRDPFRASGSLNLAFARGLPSAWVFQFRMNLARRTRSCGTFGFSSKIHTSFWKNSSGSFCYASRRASRSEKDNVRSLT